MKKADHVECAAIAARRQRLDEFRQFVDSSLKTKNVRKIIALYSLKSGLARRRVEGYLKLLTDSGLYRLRAGRLEKAQ